MKQHYHVRSGEQNKAPTQDVIEFTVAKSEQRAIEWKNALCEKGASFEGSLRNRFAQSVMNVIDGVEYIRIEPCKDPDCIRLLQFR